MGFVNKEAESLSGEDVGFSFGENWKKYLEGIDEKRIAIACRSIQGFTGLDRLTGHTFLDAGCGSGLFSLAAVRLGADRVTSIDIDPNSVECASRLHQREGRPANWTIERRSVMATGFESQSFSFVYSWGVLHHTGSMWDAIDHVATLVAPGGTFYLAIYREFPSSEAWLKIKRFYNRQPELIKPLLVAGYGGYQILSTLARGRNAFREIANYAEYGRGMSWWRDLEDWLGGLPYEYARPEQIVEFLEPRGFTCEKQERMEYLLHRK